MLIRRRTLIKTLWLLAILTLAIVVLSASHLNAQVIRIEGEATIWWEASTDGGSTWQRGTVLVADPTHRVTIRSQCQFSFPFPLNYFGGVSFDATIARPSGSRSVDGVEHILRNTRGSQPLNAQRFQSTIKIDDIDDVLAPGQGPLWVNVVQYAALSPRPDNPYWMLQYDLILDGVVGDRLIDAVFRERGGPIPPGRFVNIGIYGSDVLYYPSLTIQPLTLRVVPTPSVGLVLLAFLLGSSRRRRESNSKPRLALADDHAALGGDGDFPVVFFPDVGVLVAAAAGGAAEIIGRWDITGNPPTFARRAGLPLPPDPAGGRLV